MKKNNWHNMSLDETIKALNTDIDKGLKFYEVKSRQINNKNVIEEGKKNQALLIFLNQFTDTMVLVLLSATLISFLIGAIEDAITIMSIIILNALLGFYQEFRAEKSLEAIKKLTKSISDVKRDAKRSIIPSTELVPGDIIFLESGNKVPADIRLIQTYSLEVDESSLTGESVPINKTADDIYPPDAQISEQKNRLYMGSIVTKGRAIGVVVDVGMNTIMGEISKLIKDSKNEMTPLQIRLDQLGKVLIIICLILCSMVTLIGIIRGEDLFIMFLTGISLAVAAIPEGLPAIVTVVLAVGVQRMAKKNAVIKKLSAVETLGCTTVICSDKTGTITQNRMTVKSISVLDKTIYINDESYSRESHLYVNKKKIDIYQDISLRYLILNARHCNNARLIEKSNSYSTVGDPTEAALLVMANKIKIDEKFNLLKEIPFDSKRKKMSVIVENNNKYILFMKGALEAVLDDSKNIQDQNIIKKFGEKERRFFSDIQDEWGKKSYRVLAFAYKEIEKEDLDIKNLSDLEKDLIFLGTCGLVDPPRKGIKQSVQQCIKAGIVPIMITGDHPLTAIAIAKEVGISSEDGSILGKNIDNMNDQELYEKAMDVKVFARVLPQHKSRIVKVLQSKNQIVAMTGDGVNDAPAIKNADIGIAMGINGTDVSKEASSMILSDDNFSSIVDAVYEGRAIYDNIRKFIRYLLGCNIGEVLVMFLASLMGMPLPLLPIQILWVNLVTDGLPAMALGLEPPEPGIMTRKPRPKNESIFAQGLAKAIIARGVYIAIITLTAFTLGFIYSKYHGIDDLYLARTIALTTLVFSQLFFVFECRSEKYSLFDIGFFKNKFLIFAVLSSFIMHLLVIYHPYLQNIFNTVALDMWQLGLIILMCGLKVIYRIVRLILQIILKYIGIMLQ